MWKIMWTVVMLSLGGCMLPYEADERLPSVVPRPRRMEAREGAVELNGPVTIGLWDGAGETERYGAEMLRRDLKLSFGVDAAIVDGEERKDATVLIRILAAADPADQAATAAIKDRTEAYVIRLPGGAGKPQAVVTGSDPSGAMYGCFTLSQLFTKENGSLRLPAELYVEDWPVMETRAVVDSPGDVSRTSLDAFDECARWRINTFYYQHFYPFMQAADENGEMKPIKWTHQSRPELPLIVKEAHRRGMIIYGAIGARWSDNAWYFGEQVRYTNPKHREVLLSLWDQMADAGVDGLMFLFDDIPQGMTSEELGREHVEWMRRIKEIADRHGIKRVMMCPTHYWRGWNADYFKPFKEAKDLADIRMHFCPFAADEIAPAKAAGLLNYEWWYNGVANFPGLKSGFPYMEYGWYADANEQTRRELRSLPERTTGAWLCGGNLFVWGSYLWNPPAYEVQGLHRDMANVLLGREAMGPYMTVMRHLQTWVTNIGRKEGDLQEMRQSDKHAREAIEQLKRIVEQEERPGLLSADKRRAFCAAMDEDMAQLWTQADTVAIAANSDKFMHTITVLLRTPLAGSEVHCTLDGSEPTSFSPLYTAPLVVSNTVTIKASVCRDGRMGATTTGTLSKVEAYPAAQPGDVAPGLLYKYYEGEWYKLPDFDSLRPVAEGVASWFDIGLRKRDDHFGMRFTGYIKVPRDGVYRFYVSSDDGAMLWIGNELVVDDDARAVSEWIALAAGLHRITAGYFEFIGGEELDVAYDGPGIQKQGIPPEALFHTDR